MKRLALVLMIVSLLVLGGEAFAELCTVDAVPAATLLLPYFEVDLAAGPGAGVNTLFSINNASAAPALAHVTVWTDFTIPVLDFDVFLTGFDVQAVDLYDIFVNGNIPVTADEQSDGTTCDPPAANGGDSCSPHGDNPAWDGSFPTCGSFFPFFDNPLLTGSRLNDLQEALTGANCQGADHGDTIARGYITIDSVNDCSIDFPNDADYFNGIANNNNVLWGDFFIVDPTNNAANGDTLVHIEADDNFTGAGSGYTFYGRYTNPITGFDTEDNREPLGTTWGVRYLNGGAFDGGTDFVVWRDSTSNDTVSRGCGVPGEAGSGPSWHPLNEVEVVAFSETEDAVQLCTPPGGGGVISPPLPGGDDPTCFPLETQRVAVGEGALAPPYNFGWMYLNLNVGVDSPLGDYDPGVGGDLAQSYVSAIHDALGLFSVGLSAIELTSACDDVSPLLVPAWNIDPFFP